MRQVHAMKLMVQIEGDIWVNANIYTELVGHFLDLCSGFDDPEIADEVWLTIKAKEEKEEQE